MKHKSQNKQPFTTKLLLFCKRLFTNKNQDSKYSFSGTLGDSFYLEGRIYGAMGISHHLEYNAGDFEVAIKYKYVNQPHYAIGDEKIIQYTLKPKRCGVLEVCAIEDFSGKKKSNIKYTFLIKKR